MKEGPWMMMQEGLPTTNQEGKPWLGENKGLFPFPTTAVHVSGPHHC